MLPYKMVTKDHLKEVLQGKKKFLKMNQVKFCNPPAYDEIGVKALYDKVATQNNMAQFFPDKFPKGMMCDKSYFYNVWNTLYPEQVAEVIKYANKQRYTVSNEEAKQNSITITEEWQNEIESLPFVSKQKGRMSSLLKMKSKIAIQRKPRVTYEVHASLKRPRDAPDLAKSQSQPQASAPS